MTLFKEMLTRAALFFLLLFLTSMKISSQGQIPNQIVYRDTVIFNNLPLPIVFDSKRLYTYSPLTPESELTKPLFPPLNISKHRLFADVNHKNDIRKHAYRYIVTNNVDKIRYTTANFSGEVESVEKIPSNVFQHIFDVHYDLDTIKVDKPDRFRPKRRYWTYSGNHSIKFSQYSFSDNWYKGGMNHLNLLNTNKTDFNYSKNKFQNNNTVEWRLNLFTNSNDTIRHYRIGEDLIRTYSNFGIQAIKNWYYSTNIEIRTQLLKNFTENAEKPISAALSPVTITAGILGMRYQMNKAYPNVKSRNVNFTADISPLSIKYLAAFNKDIDPKRFGIQEGDRHQTTFGSTINSNLIYNINKNVKFTSRFQYFTNYESVQIESENKLDMTINRYFSTTLFLFIRFDDNRVPHEKWGYFQYSELLSFGFNYNW